MYQLKQRTRLSGDEEAVKQIPNPNWDDPDGLWDVCWECNEYIKWTHEHLMFSMLGKEVKPFDEWLFEKHQVYPKHEWMACELSQVVTPCTGIEKEEINKYLIERRNFLDTQKLYNTQIAFDIQMKEDKQLIEEEIKEKWGKKPPEEIRREMCLSPSVFGYLVGKAGLKWDRQRIQSITTVRWRKQNENNEKHFVPTLHVSRRIVRILNLKDGTKVKWSIKSNKIIGNIIEL